ncbi:hypothetical protein GCM10009676_45380 [Prauserella halophila]|uniref:Uncharacterized protein n=1 Tax=Prauserella halophila TaxID=185641 RepID=A0ABN1WL31_9PSEU|nr:hypothetical protein [Prauserella halophila]
MTATRATAHRRIYITWFRCAVDGNDHAVEDEAFAAGRAVGAGEYRAICGHVVAMSAAIVPNGPRCCRCFAVLDSHERRNTPRHAEQSARPGIIRRLLGRAIRTPADAPSCPRPGRSPRPEPGPGGSELHTPSALVPTGIHGLEAGA